ncbi:restriction endonuclease subunit S [Mannheimia sp. ZY171111]|uniref:restriction endonuclease subunit S n=1 Tax=Mannheimia sp. ZY171111 TaxID=2679995 RepID=UPI001ADD645F|nr:restriction endonuclease subunit S [Mannheimia sp. ZY171111]QTM00393.1 restriction endonuclease subunit S [Mannheimia sp. ZY171111]
MSNSIIEKLLNGAKVEWKPLGEIAEIYGGLTGKSKHDFENGNAKYITYKNIFDNMQIDENRLETVKVNSDEKQHQVKYGDVLFTGSSETADEAGMSSAVTVYFNEPVYLNSFSFGLRFFDEIKMMPEFSKFLFRSHFMRIEIAKTASGVTRFNISKARFRKILIPIPPLEIQQKIVKTLDKFTELEATLEAELSLRVKQYHYYRDLLLNENEKNPFFKNAEYRCLGDITLLSSNIRWKNNTNSYKYIDLTSVDRENHSIGETIEISALTAPSRAQKLVVKDDVIFATTRPTQLRFAFINEEFENSIASTGYCVLRANTDLALPKWIYHNLGSIDFKNFLEENQSGSAYPAVSDSKVKEYKIPVPSLDIQEKIILILDKFENLANSIKDGLPREIELRRKQYEYYRNELLSFSNQGG